jgi:2-polyprenyl-3-methyl-5-hydroxy-6-metoxy-1,4-benzoquinol methylase
MTIYKQLYWKDYKGEYSAVSHAEGLLDLIEGELPAFSLHTERVLDIGAGTGHLLRAFKKRYFRSEVIGIDMNPANPEVLKLNVFKAQFDAETFDVIFMTEFLEHFSNSKIHDLLSRAHTWLRPDGLLIITTPHSQKLSDYTTICPKCHNKFVYIDHKQTFNAQRLKTFTWLAGFKVQRFWVTKLALRTMLGKTMSWLFYGLKIDKAITKKLKTNFLTTDLVIICKK